MRRRSAARRPVQSLELVTLDADGAALGLVGSEPTEGADELLHAKVLTERVLAALAELDEGQRGALVLRDLEELSRRRRLTSSACRRTRCASAPIGPVSPCARSSETW